MSSIPSELKYTKEHEWLSPAGAQLTYRMGITDFAQGALGDIVYVQMPKIGESVVAVAVCGEVESTKSVSEIFAPVTGTVVAVNGALNDQPELINSQPYGDGWLIEVAVESEPVGLLTAEEYGAITG
jgi:glycine cleavage system H protein